MFKINRKLLLISIIAIGALGAGVVLINRLQVSRQGDFYLQLAHESIDEGNLDAAMNHYARAIQLGKRDYETYHEYAKLLQDDRIANYEASFMNGIRAEQAKSGQPENAFALANAAFRNGQFSDARKWSAAILQSDPINAPALLLNARALVELKEYDQAKAVFQKAIELPNATNEVFVDMANLLVNRLRDLEGGRYVVDQLISEKRVSLECFIDHGRWYLNQHLIRGISGTLSEQEVINQLLIIAVNDSEEVLKRYSDEPRAHAFAIWVATNAKDNERAVALADEALRKFPSEGSLYHQAASALMAAGDYPRARKTIQEGLDRTQGDKNLRSELRWWLAVILLEERQLEEEPLKGDPLKEGYEILAALEDAGRPKQDVQFLRARYLAAERKYLEAISLFNELRVSRAVTPELEKILDVELAKCYDGIGDRAAQIRTLQRAVSANSGWLVAREDLAFAYMKAGRLDDAAEEFRSISMLDNVHFNVVLNHARILLKLRNWSDFDRLMNELQGHPEIVTSVAILKAEALIAKDQFDDARQLLASQDPRDMLAKSELYAARILVEVKQKAWGAADTLIAEARDLQLDSLSMRLAQAIRMFQNEDAVDRIVELANVPVSWSPEDRRNLALLLLNQASQEENEVLVDRLSQLVIGLDPSNIACRLARLESAVRQADASYRLLERMTPSSGGVTSESPAVDEERSKIYGEFDRFIKMADRELSEIKLITGQKSGLWHFGNALVITGENDAKALMGTNFNASAGRTYSDAEDQLRDAALLSPEEARVFALAGYVLQKLGREDAAIEKYNEAIRKGWRDPETVQRYLGLLMKKERFADADAVFRSLSQSDSSLSSQMFLLAAQSSKSLKNLDRASELAEQAAELSGAVEDYLWLSDIRELNRDKAGAEEALRKALDIDAKNLRAKISWIRFLQRAGRLDEAKSVALDMGAEMENPTSTQRVLLAKVFDYLGMTERMEEVLAHVHPEELDNVDVVKDFYALRNLSSNQDRIAFLSSLMNAKKSQRDNLRVDAIYAWARRELALVWLGIDRSGIEEAKKLFPDTDARMTQNPSLEDRRVMAIILAVEVGASNPDIPLAAFERLLREGWAPEPVDLYLLGNLYIEKGDWGQGSRYFSQLLTRNEKGDKSTYGTYLKRYIQLLLEKGGGRRTDVSSKDGGVRGDPREAELWLNVLIRDGAVDSDAARFLAEIRFQRNQWDVLVRDLVGEELGVDEVTWMVNAVSFVERFKWLNEYLTRLRASNETAYTKYAPIVEAMAKKAEEQTEFPGAFYATQLLMRREFDQAYNVLRKVLETSTNEELDQCANLLLQSEGLPIEAVERFENLFQTSSRVQEQNIQLIIARLKEVRGDFSGAETIYRSRIEKDPNDLFSLNNLANLLALRGQKLEEAVAMIDRALALDGRDSAMLLDTRSVCYVRLKDYQLARRDLEKAIKQFDHQLFRYHLAWTHFLDGKEDLAKMELQIAKKLGLRKADLHILDVPEYERMCATLGLDK